MKYIDSEKLIAEINRVKDENAKLKWACASQISSAACCKEEAYDKVLSFITYLQQEQPEVDLEKLKNKAELIANEIMMGVQANKYHTCIYNKASNDFNHSHLFRAALKGIELGLNARKEESK